MSQELERKIIELIDDYLHNGLVVELRPSTGDKSFWVSIDNPDDSPLCKAIENSGMYINEDTLANGMRDAATIIAESMGHDPRFLMDIIQAIKQAGRHDPDNNKFEIKR